MINIDLLYYPFLGEPEQLLEMTLGRLQRDVQVVSVKFRTLVFGLRKVSGTWFWVVRCRVCLTVQRKEAVGRLELNGPLGILGGFLLL